MVFQLADSNTKAETPTSGNDSNSNSGTTNQSTNNSTGTISEYSSIILLQYSTMLQLIKLMILISLKQHTDLLKLTIELKVSGDKNKVEKYIRSLNTLTLRKINVKSIKLEATAYDSRE